jgi:hypothetical protein
MGRTMVQGGMTIDRDTDIPADGGFGRGTVAEK